VLFRRRTLHRTHTCPGVPTGVQVSKPPINNNSPQVLRSLHENTFSPPSMKIYFQTRHHERRSPQRMKWAGGL
ncbi:MAG: hypothetical protein WA821_02450, partial [Anaerolineales bacterium]